MIVDVDPKRLPLIMEHNRKTLDGDALLPNFDNRIKPNFIVLHTNHLTMIGRCFHEKIPTTQQNIELGVATPGDGRLSLNLLKQRDAAFAEYIMEGFRAIRLCSEIHNHPKLVQAIVTSFNHNLALGETERGAIADGCF